MEPMRSIDLRQSSTVKRLLYRCACGTDFHVQMEQGGACPNCQRNVQPEALRSAMTATVSISGLEEPSHISHLELHSIDDVLQEQYGHFRLDKKLGHGGMGSVFRALDTSLQRFVAVKVMRQSGKDLDTRVAAMLREAIAQARLNHPNVVTIYYVGREGEEPFLAMELLPGPTLAEKIKSEGPVTYGDAIRYGMQVVSALEHAHQFGIVHGDVKPANLLLTTEHDIKLSDFGLSSLPSNEKSGVVSGTPAYLAPEVLEGSISIQSDMYALGVTLFELVFSRLPFVLHGETVRERLSTHLTATIDFPSEWPNHIPRAFAAIISKLLAKKPEERYASYEELRQDLQSIQPVSTTTAAFSPRLMGYIIDQLMFLVCLSPFALTILFLTARDDDNELRSKGLYWLIPVVAFASLVVPAIYLFLVYRGWRSLGRYLFQLRIVEENGLPPRREQLVTREVLRNALAWLGPLVIYVSLFYEQIGIWPDLILALFLAADAGVILLRKDRKALHDYLCRSKVVLATNRSIPTI
jgi:serine/threonine protein kinase